MTKKRLSLLTLCAVIMFSFVVVAPANAESEDLWAKKAFVDDFGDPTDKKYIECKINDGTFSNSATNNSPLIARVVATLNYFGQPEFQIFLHEYANKSPSYILKDTWIIQIKDTSNKQMRLYGKSQGDRITMLGKDAEKLNEVLVNGGKVRFVVEPMTWHSKYSFTIKNASGYGKEFDAWLKK